MKYISLIVLSLFLLGISTAPKKKFVPEKEAVLGKNGIWFMKNEVSNKEYKDFLIWIIEKNRAAEIPALAPDMSVWTRDLEFNDPYMNYYFAHPTFDDYPVVGIDRNAGIAYCNYLTEKYKDYEIKSKSIIPKGMQAKFRLPSAAEWELFARSESANNGLYPGGFADPRNSKGNFNFNHKPGEGDYTGSTYDKEDNIEGYVITAPKNTFYADKIGLYNMAGNVAEMVQEEGIAKGGSWRHEKDSCTVAARLHYDKPNTWVGIRPVFEVVAVSEEELRRRN